MVSKAVLFAPAAAYRCCGPPSQCANPLSSRVATLPVGNKPLVRHGLEALVDAGIRQIAVLSAPSVADEVRAIVSDATAEQTAAAEVIAHAGSFTDALIRVNALVGTEPFVVHLGDSLTRTALGPAIAGTWPAKADVMALVEESEGDATPLAAGLASVPTAGVYVFGPEVLQLASRQSESGDWDVEIAAAMDRLTAAGGNVELRPVRDWWRFRQRPGAVLQANRFFLSGLRDGPTEAWLENSDLQGPVEVDPTARLTSTTVRGPAIIGPRVELRDAYIGPYTSIGADVMIENAELENSVLLPGASIRHLGGRLEASVVGPRARIFRDFRLPRAVRVNIGEDAEITIA